MYSHWFLPILSSPHVEYLLRLGFGTERACLVDDAVFVAPQ
jgi:hypothetical protein